MWRSWEEEEECKSHKDGKESLYCEMISETTSAMEAYFTYKERAIATHAGHLYDRGAR